MGKGSGPRDTDAAVVRARRAGKLALGRGCVVCAQAWRRLGPVPRFRLTEQPHRLAPMAEPGIRCRSRINSAENKAAVAPIPLAPIPRLLSRVGRLAGRICKASRDAFQWHHNQELRAQGTRDILPQRGQGGYPAPSCSQVATFPDGTGLRQETGRHERAGLAASCAWRRPEGILRSHRQRHLAAHFSI